MYVRRNRKQRKDGTKRVEVMLAHNVRVQNASGDAVTKPIVMARLGNEEDLDGGFIDQAIAALERYKLKRRQELAAVGESETPVEEAVAVKRYVKPLASSLRVLASKQLGVRLVVERVWKDLGLQRVLGELEAEHCRTVPFERVVFAMVVNRLVDPMAKLACNDWAQDQGHFPEADGWTVDHFYRALDVLEAHLDEIGDHVAKAILDRLPEDERASLLADTTTVFTEAALDDVQRAEIRKMWREYEDGKADKPADPFPQVTNEPPLRMRGKSKDHRPDVPQIVVGLVATTSGLPVSHAVYPGNTSDRPVTREMATDVARRHPDQEVCWVMDSGMAGAKNLKWLDEMGGRPGWLCGMPVRKSKLVDAVLAAPGPWEPLERTTADSGWTYRSVDLGEAERINPNRPERLIAVRNPKRERRDLRKLENEVAKVTEHLATDPSPSPRSSRAQVLSRPSLARLTRLVDGKLELDTDAIEKERQLAGVKVLRTTEMNAPVSRVVAGYDDLLKLEGDFRTFKSPLRVRPMYHRSAHRIRAHVMMCFLALVCQNEIERRSGKTWAALRKGLDQVHAVKMGHGNDMWWQHSELSERANAALEACGVAEIEARWVLSDLPAIRWAK
jgi:hypothetical protein